MCMTKFLSVILTLIVEPSLLLDNASKNSRTAHSKNKGFGEVQQ